MSTPAKTPTRALDPKWQSLHALLQSFVQEHRQNDGKVRPALREALFIEFDARLRDLTQMVAARYAHKGTDPDALALRVLDKNATFTKLMQRYSAQDARQGFNWFYTVVLNCLRDMQRSGRRSVAAINATDLYENDLEGEAFDRLLAGVNTIDEDIDSRRVQDKLAQLPSDWHRLAAHAFFGEEDDLTQAQIAQDMGISLATYKRRKGLVQRYLRGELSLVDVQK
jgi:DNA-directed RNA polymerase specialized sigma24 family protein